VRLEDAAILARDHDHRKEGELSRSEQIVFVTGRDAKLAEQRDVRKEGRRRITHRSDVDEVIFRAEEDVAESFCMAPGAREGCVGATGSVAELMQAELRAVGIVVDHERAGVGRQGVPDVRHEHACVPMVGQTERRAECRDPLLDLEVDVDAYLIELERGVPGRGRVEVFVVQGQLNVVEILTFEPIVDRLGVAQAEVQLEAPDRRRALGHERTERLRVAREDALLEIEREARDRGARRERAERGADLVLELRELGERIGRIVGVVEVRLVTRARQGDAIAAIEIGDRLVERPRADSFGIIASANTNSAVRQIDRAAIDAPRLD
jgi:hypothetical protein